MKFQPRNEYEREAFDIEPPKFDLGQRVRTTHLTQSNTEGTITDIYLRTVDWPVWLYRIDEASPWLAWTDLEAVKP